jgi:hypothetical protein
LPQKLYTICTQMTVPGSPLASPGAVDPQVEPKTKLRSF